MSIGNTKDYGNKGNNFPYQLKSLQGLDCVCSQMGLSLAELQAINANTDQVEGLLTLIANLLQDGQDYEATIVVDANDVTWLEIRIFNSDTQTFDPPIYYAAGSNTPGTPVAPLVYINPNTYLAQIVSNTTGIALEATQQDVLTEVTTIVSNTTGIALEATQQSVLSEVQDILSEAQTISSNTTGISLEATQQDVLTELQTVVTNTTGLATEATLVDVETNTADTVSRLNAQTRVPHIRRAISAAATIPDDIFSISFSNVGTANATVNTEILKPGETINFDAGALNNYYPSASFEYDATTSGAELLIIFTTA
jgi:hypothetical protein